MEATVETVLTKREIEQEIFLLKANLAETDYLAIKFAEGCLSGREFAKTRAERADWRAKINELEEKLKTL